MQNRSVRYSMSSGTDSEHLGLVLSVVGVREEIGVSVVRESLPLGLDGLDRLESSAAASGPLSCERFTEGEHRRVTRLGRQQRRARDARSSAPTRPCGPS